MTQDRKQPKLLILVMRHEWHNLRTDKTVWIILILFATLVSYGIYNGASWTGKLKESNDRLIAEGEKELVELKAQLADGTNEEAIAAGGGDATNPANITNQFAILPVTSLTLFSVGQSDILPNFRSIQVTSQQHTISDKYGFENPLNLLTGRFDLTFVILYLFPLLILAITYNIISAEREQGTLAMLLSQPVKPVSFTLGKIALRACLIFTFAILLPVAGVLAAGVSFQTEEPLIRLLLWVLVVIAYGAFWFAAALAVNTMGWSSATNAVALCGVWLVFVLIIPALISVVVTALYPLPSRTEQVAAMRDVQYDMRRDGKRLLAEFYADHPELLPADGSLNLESFGLAYVTIQQEVKQQAEEVEARFDQQLSRQQAMVNRFRFISPAIVAQEAMNDIAGTGIARYQHFKSLVRAHTERWDQFFVPKMYKMVKLTASDYNTLPIFVFQEESLFDITDRVFTGILGMIIPALIVSFLGIKSRLRYMSLN
jgi:ABC-2 type transport system permease protein